MSKQGKGSDQSGMLEDESGLEAFYRSPAFRGPIEPPEDIESQNGHLALIYESHDEQFAAAVPFVRQGLERGEQCLYIADENSREDVLAAMRAGNVDVDAALESGALRIQTKRETHLQDGTFDPDEMIAYLDEVIDDAVEEYEALRITGETTWVFSDEPTIEDLVEYELKLEDLLPDTDSIALCQYNRERFPPEVIHDIVRIHPHLIYDGTIYYNIFHTPPEEFLGPDQPAREVERMLESLRDQTETKVQLKERERQLSTLTDSIPGMIYRCRNEPGWPMAFVSDGCQELTGYAPGALEADNVSYGSDIVVEEDREQLWEEVQRGLAEDGRFLVTYRIRTADGDVRWVRERGRGIYDDSRNLSVLEGVIIDVTEQKRLEVELDDILGRITDAFYALDDQWRFTHINDRAEELIDYTGEGLVGKNVWEVFEWAADSKVREEYERAMATQEPTSFEQFYPESLDAWYEVNAYSSETGLSVYFRDISDRKERERERLELIERLEESNQRLEQFAHAASHDLQEPLRMVSSYLQMIEHRYEDTFDEEGQEYLEFAVDGADRMREMIDGLLTYSRVESRGDPFEAIDLGGVLEDVLVDLQLQIDESDAEITSDDLPRVEGDPEQLRQLFQNLLVNAIEYCGETPPQIDISAAREGSQWRISVSDQGIGIDPDDQERIFQVFQRLHSRDKHDGAGIGLALCKRIVERHDGDIWVESAPGEGSTFSFTLPTASNYDH